MQTAPRPVPPPDVFDVTIRDGSYVIDFQFRQEDVRLLCRSLDHCGFRYVEVGHGLGLNASVVKAAAAATDDEYLSAAAESCSHARFGAFFIPGIGQFEHLRRAREQFGMHFVRLGSEPEKYEQMLPFLEYARGLGYEVMCNFMKTYAEPAAAIARKAAVLARAGADAVYVVDSAGGMLPDEVGEYVRAIAEHCPARIGFHGHNNLEMALANSLSAWRNGATLIDCSVGGLGRSSGNTRTELLIPVLKALGVAAPYDFEEVLRLWQQTIRPLMHRRPVSAQEIVGGYARVHSGLMGPFLEAARKHEVSVVSLLDAYGDALHDGRPSAGLDQLASQLKARRPAAGESRPSGSLLQMHPPAGDHAIRNTFRSVDEVLRAVHVLAHKACLPVVALVDVAPVVSEEPYLVAEYLYHDDHFVVLRTAFGAVASFLDVMRQHGDWFDVLVFDRKAAAARAELVALAPQWHRHQKILWVDLTAAKHHTLFAALYQAAAHVGARSALLLGGSPDLLARFVPPALDGLDVYCAAPDPNALNNVGITRLDAHRPGTAGASRPLPAQFDVVALLSPLTASELELVLARLSPGGTLLDCLGPASGPALPNGAAAASVVRVSLWKSITGEVLNLLGAVERQGAGSPRERDLNATRTRAA
jgi:4-hydroxy-2-oxovalerate aldolase